jgi:predicted nucleotidyltransferase
MGTTQPTLIFETIHGSRAYNLHRPESDTDYKGIIVGPSAWYHGFRGGPEQLELSADHVRFEIRKFFTLAVAANPTILEMLWTDPACYQTVTPAGERLLQARRAFLSRRVQTTFAGYALSQLKRIKTHRRWLLSPPDHGPSRAEFGLPEQNVIPRDQLGALTTLMQRGDLAAVELSPNFLDLLDREKRYRQARQEWSQYQEWQKNRNPVRAALEAQFGYDTKHAMHLVRLQRMASEILRQERVIVTRPDHEELRAIRQGAWDYDQLLEMCQKMEQDIDEAARTSGLPAAPDEDNLNALCESIVTEVIHDA